MGYLHIDNLYKDPRIIALGQGLYALEKIHGTSAHVAFDGVGGVRLFSGGETHERFAALFDMGRLESLSRGAPITVYGEAYGGKCQGMSHTYGPELRFVAFDVRCFDVWLDVPSADFQATALGFEFVGYALIEPSVRACDAERDKDSTQALRNGMGPGKMREGVVLRPQIEGFWPDGSRIIAKHKRPEFRETKTPREVDPSRAIVLESARAVAEEWVTQMRLTHVLDKMGNPGELERTGDVVRAMIEDVLREGAGEVADTPEVRKAVGSAAARMFKGRVVVL